MCQEAMDQYRVECNPARSFLMESCRESCNHQVPTELLYDHYRTWCSRNGYQPLGERAFGKEVVRVFPNVVKKRGGSRGARQYVYDGILFEGLLSHDYWLS